MCFYGEDSAIWIGVGGAFDVYVVPLWKASGGSYGFASGDFCVFFGLEFSYWVAVRDPEMIVVPFGGEFAI